MSGVRKCKIQEKVNTPGALPAAEGDGGNPSLSGIVTSKRDDDGLGYEVGDQLKYLDT